MNKTENPIPQVKKEQITISPIARLNIERTKKVFQSKENIDKFQEIVLNEYSNNPKMEKALQQLNSMAIVGKIDPERFVNQASKFVFQVYSNQKDINPSILYIGNLILDFVKSIDS
jgi:hypothetical protein